MSKGWGTREVPFCFTVWNAAQLLASLEGLYALPVPSVDLYLQISTPNTEMSVQNGIAIAFLLSGRL